MANVLDSTETRTVPPGAILPRELQSWPPALLFRKINSAFAIEAAPLLSLSIVTLSKKITPHQPAKPTLLVQLLGKRLILLEI